MHRLKSPPCIQKENLQVMRNLGPKMHEISKLGGDFSTPNDAESGGQMRGVREGEMWISKICLNDTYEVTVNGSKLRFSPPTR